MRALIEETGRAFTLDNHELLVASSDYGGSHMKTEKLLKRWCELVGILAEAILEGCDNDEWEATADHVYELLVATRSHIGLPQSAEEADDANDE